MMETENSLHGRWSQNFRTPWAKTTPYGFQKADNFLTEGPASEHFPDTSKATLGAGRQQDDALPATEGR